MGKRSLRRARIELYRSHGLRYSQRALKGATDLFKWVSSCVLGQRFFHFCSYWDPVMESILGFVVWWRFNLTSLSSSLRTRVETTSGILVEKAEEGFGSQEAFSTVADNLLGCFRIPFRTTGRKEAALHAFLYPFTKARASRSRVAMVLLMRLAEILATISQRGYILRVLFPITGVPYHAVLRYRIHRYPRHQNSSKSIDDVSMRQSISEM